MIISGIQKLTLLDYPEKVACTLFTYGCNLRCPFCHNSEIVVKEAHDLISEDSFFKFLDTRKGILDAVCISGGEPLLNMDIMDFIKQIKDRGFLVKLDTNGTQPSRLQLVCDTGLVDYVAMDVKNSIDKYSVTCGVDKIVVGKVIQSVNYLMSQNKFDYEFRTTVTKSFHTHEDIESLTQWIKGCSHYYIQKYISSDSVIDPTCLECDDETLKDFLEIAKRNIPNAELRGVDFNDPN